MCGPTSENNYPGIQNDAIILIPSPHREWEPKREAQSKMPFHVRSTIFAGRLWEKTSQEERTNQTTLSAHVKKAPLNLEVHLPCYTTHESLDIPLEFETSALLLPPSSPQSLQLQISPKLPKVDNKLISLCILRWLSVGNPEVSESTVLGRLLQAIHINLLLVFASTEIRWKFSNFQSKECQATVAYEETKDLIFGWAWRAPDCRLLMTKIRVDLLPVGNQIDPLPAHKLP